MQKPKNIVTVFIGASVILFLMLIQIKQRTLKEINRQTNYWRVLLNFLNENNIFLVDAEKLKEIKIFKNSSWIELDFDKFASISNTLSFGVMNTDTSHLLNVIYLFF